MNTTIITADLVPEARRLRIAAKLFGVRFPLQLEPTIYQFAEFLSGDYRGGYWHFYTLSNGGFYMAPSVRSNSSKSSGLKSRLGSCPYAPVA